MGSASVRVACRAVSPLVESLPSEQIEKERVLRVLAAAGPLFAEPELVVEHPNGVDNAGVSHLGKASAPEAPPGSHLLARECPVVATSPGPFLESSHTKPEDNPDGGIQKDGFRGSQLLILVGRVKQSVSDIETEATQELSTTSP